MIAMKSSGIAWIGDIPANWDVIRLKLYAYLKGRIGWQGLKAEEFIDEGPYLVTGTDFENGRICWERSYHISEHRYEEAPQIQLRVGDLLVTKDGTIGKLAYVDYLPDKASLNSHLLLIRPLQDKFRNEFLFWVLGSTVFQGYYELASDGTTMDSLSQEKIGNLNFALPPILEQRAIAALLCDRCSYIDGIVADLERQVEILRQYKKVLITETVIKGLNKSAQLKDSGIEWIGEIPANWEIKKIKYCANKIGSGKTPLGGSEIYEQEGVTFIRSQNVYDDGLRLDDVVYIHPSIDNSMASTRVLHNDVLFNITGASIGRCCVYNLTDRANVNQHVCIIRTNSKRLLPEFLRYVLNSTIGQTQVILCQMGGNRESVTFEQLGMFSIIVPPINEQQAMVDHLNCVCAEADALIAEKQRSVEAMRQYKRSLIYEYVTGKKRVAS